MKRIKWPKVKVTTSEKLWMKELYKSIKKGIRPQYQEVKIALRKKLPLNFSPNQIDPRLVSDQGHDLTLFGICFIDPQNRIVDKINKVVKCIQNLIVKDHSNGTFTTEVISRKTGISEQEVGLIIKLISQYGRFWSQASGASDSKSYGFTSFQTNNDTGVFDQYIDFTCIEDLINQYYKEDREKRLKLESVLTAKKPPIKTKVIKKRNRNSPVFKSIVRTLDPESCFVLMPFTEPWSDKVYNKYLKPNIKLAGLNCERADNLVGPIIIEDIWKKINHAGLIIADVTGKNPNVMYEMGIVHSIGKPAILITQNVNERPFDFAHLRHYEYKLTEDGADKFRRDIIRIIKEMYKEIYPDTKLKPKEGSPMIYL